MTMLTELDEHFYHQTPSPVDSLRDTDPRYVDQHWFQCMDVEGRWIVGANWPVWPNTGLIENGQIIVHGDTQYNLRYSSTIERDGYKSARTNQKVGPASMEVIEPLRKARFTLSPENHWGISYDLTMDTFLRPVQTRTPIAFAGSPTLPGVLPYFEIMGRWTGELNVDGTTYEVNHENTWGQRDRCWASLGGERWQGWTGPSPGGAHVSPRGPGRIHWHSHIQFDDIGFWWWMDEFMGKPRLGGTLSDNRGSHFDGAVTWRMDDPRQEIRIVDFTNIDIVAQAGTKKFQEAQITLIDEFGTEYDLEFEIIKPNWHQRGHHRTEYQRRPDHHRHQLHGHHRRPAPNPAPAVVHGARLERGPGDQRQLAGIRERGGFRDAEHAGLRIPDVSDPRRRWHQHRHDYHLGDSHIVHHRPGAGPRGRPPAAPGF